LTFGLRQTKKADIWRDSRQRSKMRARMHIAEGQLRPNPGWLPLHPDQRRGHEAPARLNTQHRTDGTHITRPHAPGHHQPKKAALKRPASDDNLRHTSTLKAAKSHQRIVAGLNNMSLRERKGQPPPPSPRKCTDPHLWRAPATSDPGTSRRQDMSGKHPRTGRRHPTLAHLVTCQRLRGDTHRARRATAITRNSCWRQGTGKPRTRPMGLGNTVRQG
jgi:hypothetical protein